MTKPCLQCSQPFEITSADEEFYRLLEVPAPTHCYFCRMVRRLAYRNERFLYHRVCDLSGKQIISAFSKESAENRVLPKFPVYDIDEWWSDKWNPKSFGRPFDFSRPFFEQFFELQSVVPRLALQQQKPMENSAYCNAASRNKNCYLVFSTNHCEDCYYGSWINYSRDCIDNTNIRDCELCYECVYVRNCYRCFFAQESKNCQNCFFIKNCLGCKNCFMCTNLVQKEYHILNKPYSKEEYFKKLQELNFGSRTMIQKIQAMFQDICEKSPVKYYVGTNNENSVGNYINNNKNCFLCFEVDNIEDGRYCMNLDNSKNVMDHSYWGQNSERTYECQACGYDLFNLCFCNLCWEGCSDLTYCDHCFASKNCFGCVGLKKASYCILNQQYTKEEYEELVPRIIEYMQTTPYTPFAKGDKTSPLLKRPVPSGLRPRGGLEGSCEWGEFFPISHSTFAYNESLAHEQLPLSKQEVLQRGWQWIDRSQEYQYQGPKVVVPDKIADVSPEITKQILTCEQCGRNYKLIAQELAFYQTNGLPVPVLCSDCRHRQRIALRNPRKLWDRNCQQCGTALQTSYAPDRKEPLYCDACYQKAVY